MNLTEIIFVLSTYLITFLIVSVIRFFLELPLPGSNDLAGGGPDVTKRKNIDLAGGGPDVTKRKVVMHYLEKRITNEKKHQLFFLKFKIILHRCFRALFVILPNLFISAILTHFIYKFYPFEPTIPNTFTIIGSLFGIFIASYFIYKSF